MDLIDAANLIQKAYDNKLGSLERVRFNVAGAQAVMLKDGTLIIPGTNEVSDWSDFNFNVSNGDSGRKWHAGFLKHAQLVFTFAKGATAKRVLGHSLGAASAQIVACSLGVPALCFASPQPLRGRTRFKGEHRITNICRTDDAVTDMPFKFVGFRHLGKVHELFPGEKQSAGSHKLKDYIRAMKQGRARPELPASWP